MTKRKTPEEKAARKPRKHVAFSAPGNAATKAVIARNASRSPLLRLPLEVRNKIWREVLGGQLIHLKYYYDDEVDFETNEDLHAGLEWCSELGQTYGSAWRHQICEDDGPEDREDEKKRFSTIEVDGEDDYYLRPHQICDPNYDPPSPDAPIQFYDHETIRLAILRSCRQAYVEANQILWTTNTFAFSDATTFKRFMMTRNIHQKRMIKSLRLEAEWDMYGNSQEWNSALNMTLVSTLSGLRQLRMQVDYKLEAHLFRVIRERNMLYSTSFCEGMHRLSTLPLTEVEIGVRNPQYLSENSLWTKTDRDEYAEGLRKILLDPKGAEIYAAEKRREKVENRRQRELEAEWKASMSSSRRLPQPSPP